MKKEITLCFSGYRPGKFNFLLNDDNIFYKTLLADLHQAANNAYLKGYKNFIYGGAMGFDIIAAEVVVNLMQSHKDINLYLYKPHPRQERAYTKEWKQRYNLLLKSCKKIVLLSTDYTSGCFHLRNRKMVDDSSLIITYYNGLAGGTKSTYDYALKKGIEIINLYK